MQSDVEDSKAIARVLIQHISRLEIQIYAYRTILNAVQHAYQCDPPLKEQIDNVVNAPGTHTMIEEKYGPLLVQIEHASSGSDLLRLLQGGPPSVSVQRGAPMADDHRLQLGKPVAAAGATEEDRQLVADELAAAAREDGRAVGEACPLLLVDAGREPSDAAPVWKHGAAD